MEATIKGENLDVIICKNCKTVCEEITVFATTVGRLPIPAGSRLANSSQNLSFL
jgi:hypothetical protein